MLDRRPIVWMDDPTERDEAPAKGPRRQAVHDFSLGGPALVVATQVPIPGAHAAGEQRQAITFFTGSQRGLGVLAREELLFGNQSRRAFAQMVFAIAV